MKKEERKQTGRGERERERERREREREVPIKSLTKPTARRPGNSAELVMKISSDSNQIFRVCVCTSLCTSVYCACVCMCACVNVSMCVSAPVKSFVVRVAPRHVSPE